jgi:hypothetical protein
MTDCSLASCYPCEMDPYTTPLERAFELARSGKVATVIEIKKQLRAEGFDVAQITGTTLTKQLNTLIRAATADRI